jgi:hypothetical protein
MSFDLGNLLNSGSFDNFWYWAIIAVTWSRATHFLLGAGLHDVRDALKNGGQDMIDVETLININARKLMHAIDRYGVGLCAITTFFIATIVTLGFKFEIELMQAAAFLLIGLLCGFLVSLRFAHRVVDQKLLGEALCAAFNKFRTYKQFVGITAIFLTSFYAAFYLVFMRGI